MRLDSCSRRNPGLNFPTREICVPGQTGRTEGCGAELNLKLSRSADAQRDLAKGLCRFCGQYHLPTDRDRHASAWRGFRFFRFVARLD